jgi:signal transduction histidine kinase
MRKRNLLSSFLLIALAQFHFTYSQDVVLATDEPDNIIINPHAYLFKEKTANINEIDKVSAAPDSAFLKNTRFQEINYGFSQPSGWCKFTIKNTTGHTNWILKVHQSRVDTVQLYLQRQDGALIRYPLTGHFQSIKERSFYSLHFAHPIFMGKNETVTCYLFTQRKFARHAAILSLQKENYYRNYDTRFIIFISALVGISVLAILIGIVLFLFLYEKVYIYYSIYCFSFLLLVSADTGFLYAFFNDIAEQKLVNNLSIVFYYWIVGWHILFTMELLEIKKHPQRWMYWTGLISGLLCCMASLILLLPIPDLLRSEISQWSYYTVFFLDTYILYTMISQLAKREVVVYFYMAGFLFTLVAASILMLADLNLIEGINQKTDIFFIAPVVEILCMVIGLGINSSKHVREKWKAQVLLNETQNQIITVQENERRRIAQDLHDDVGNSLAAVKNMLVQRNEPVLIENEIDNIIRDIRNISHDLMPVDFEEYALTDIIRQTVNKFKGHPDIQFEYEQTGAAVKLKPVTELVVYRIINELITNSIRHSQATDMMIQLMYQKESLVVMVEDNGIGLNHTNGNPGKGIGLMNIRHRVAYIRATLTIESDHKGTLAIIEIPYEEKV